jgi:hypothetical protein
MSLNKGILVLDILILYLSPSLLRIFKEDFIPSPFKTFCNKKQSSLVKLSVHSIIV